MIARFVAPLLLSLRLYDAPAGWNVLAYNWHTHDRVREWNCAEARERGREPPW